MVYQYKTSGTCSSRIEFELDDDNRVHNVHFTNGCNGNLKGISAIVEGMDADELISKLGGITCGFKSTSCPDQLAKAVRQALDKK
ncbi:MAG: TIGR03905 family TSCPD domain-containing protein [Acutalibacteraceae bacterium]